MGLLGGQTLGSSRRRGNSIAVAASSAQPTWEELIEQRIAAESGAKGRGGEREDMWGWEPSKERVLLVGVLGERHAA